MPSKGRKAASRQAELNRKKRRSKNPRQPEFEAAPVMSLTGADTAVAEPDTEASETVDSSTDQPRPEAARPATRVRSPRRSSGQRAATVDSTPLVYRYLGKEIRQIGAISSLIVVILVALTFVLR